MVVDANLIVLLAFLGSVIAAVLRSVR